MKYSAIVLCAGSGKRTGLSYNKIFYKIDNETIYEKTLSIFISDNDCEQILVVTKEDEVNELQKLVRNHKIEYVMGGKERQDSVYEGLQKVKQTYVMIHDGARPYITKVQIEEVKNCLLECQACLLMVPCKDTIKEVKEGYVVQTLQREFLMQAQTPQAFSTEVVKEAYEKAKQQNFLATDDASLVETFTDVKIKVVMGSYDNTKVTTKEDLL